MRTFFANTLFATASIILTATVVAASASPAAAVIPADVATQTVRFADLNLADHDGRAELDARIHAAAEAVCSASHSRDTVAMQCRDSAVAQANRDVAGQIASRLRASVANVAP